MPARLPESKRIRSIVGPGGSATVLDGVAWDSVIASYTFQDDITLIGCWLRITPMIDDALTNQDTFVHGNLELSRSGSRAQPGTIARVCVSLIWNGLFSIGSGSSGWDDGRMLWFPEGYGWEFDEGEAINLLAFLQYKGAIASVDWWGECVLFYVER